MVNYIEQQLYFRLCLEAVYSQFRKLPYETCVEIAWQLRRDEIPVRRRGTDRGPGRWLAWFRDQALRREGEFATVARRRLAKPVFVWEP